MFVDDFPMEQIDLHLEDHMPGDTDISGPSGRGFEFPENEQLVDNGFGGDQ